MTVTELIEENTAYTKRIVSTFIRKNPNYSYLSEDLYAEGVLRLVQCARRFNAGGIQKLRQYLRLCIITGCYDVTRREETIQNPKTCLAQRFHGDGGELAEWEDRENDEELSAYAVCTSLDELHIVRGLKAGLTPREIAKRYGLQLCFVQLTGREILERYREWIR